MSEFKKRLSKMQGNWDAGKEKAGDQIPDGLYKFQLQDAEIVESQSSEKLMIHVEHLLLEGEHAGQVHHDYLQLETEWGPVFVAQFIEKLGREVPDNSEELEEVVAEIAEAAPVYMAKLKTKDDFTNLRITKLLEGEAEKTVVEKDEDEGEELDWSKGERCSVEIDGEDFEGKVTKIKGDKATVKFDDGDSDTFPLIELSEIDEDEDEESEEEEEEEEEESEAEESDKYTADEIMDMSAEDLRQLVEDNELEVKLGKAITAKKRKAVVEALEEEDMLRESDEEEEEEEEEVGEDAPVTAGGRVTVELEGEDYEGEVTEVDLEEKSVRVKFDDGDESDHDWADITVLKINNQKKGKKSKGKGKSKSKAPNADDLTAFCQAQDIEVDDDDDVESMTEKVLEYDWEAEQLTKEEVELCKQLGATVK